MGPSAAKISSAYRLKLAVLAGLGYRVEPGSAILDFGCGAGLAIRYLRERGFAAFGYDVDTRVEPRADPTDLIEQGIIRVNTDENARLPFPDDMFDVALSYQVFEHVQNYEHSVAELARVLKPGGVSLHVFPSRYRILEAHNGAPFSPLLPHRWWLELWSRLGCCRRREAPKTREEWVDWDYHFLHNGMNYLPGKAIRRHFEAGFRKVEFVPREFLLRSERLRRLAPVVCRIPFLPALFGTFWTRVLLAAEPRRPG
jgi:SAM-dependent methyltransferase